MVRVRFAPSPTGHLHLGGARTALFNWLYARGQNGKFILRIEDTDAARSNYESTKAIFDGLKWLGIDWDEGPKVDGPFGPYYQSKRLDLYRQHAEQLVNQGKAYYCFCTPEELEKKRKAAAKRKQPPRYDGTCRKLSAEDVKKKMQAGQSCVIRFRLPDSGAVFWDDKVRGKIEFKNEVLDDFVIMKSDGFPTYNFAAAVDDHLMEITHIIRGDDHIANTPRQLLIYQAFGWKPPKFAHIPMILGPDKTKLSKRHGATSVFDYHEKGYLPEAMLNYLARLGWGYKDEEIFSREDLIKKFSLKNVSKNPAIFDFDKLNWLNAHYIRKAVPERIIDLCESHIIDAFGAQDFEYMSKVVRLCMDRLVLIPDIVELTRYFFSDDIKYDQKAVEKYFKGGKSKDILLTIKDRLEKTEPFNKEEIEKVFKDTAKEKNLKLGQAIHPCRLALTGGLQSPPMYDVVELLGKKKVIERLERAADL